MKDNDTRIRIRTEGTCRKLVVPPVVPRQKSDSVLYEFTSYNGILLLLAETFVRAGTEHVLSLKRSTRYVSVSLATLKLVSCWQLHSKSVCFALPRGVSRQEQLVEPRFLP